MNSTATQISPLSYFHCHNLVPDGVLIASTVVSGLLSLLMFNSAFGASCFFSNKDLYQVFNAMERRAIIIQYLIAMPLFELLVVWGPQLTPSIDHNSSSSVINWLVVNSMSLGLVIGSLFATHRYRMLIHVAQCFRLPLATMYFCDRAINFTIGVEGVFIGAVFFCATFEMVHVHQYYTKYKRTPLLLVKSDATALASMQPPPLPPVAMTMALPFVSKRRRQRAGDKLKSTSSSSSSDEEAKKRPFVNGNSMHIYPGGGSADEDEDIPTPTTPATPKDEVNFASGVPLTVREGIMNNRRTKRVAEHLKQLSEMRGNISDNMFGTIARQLHTDLAQTANSSTAPSSQSAKSSTSVSDDKRTLRRTNPIDNTNNETESDF